MLDVTGRGIIGAMSEPEVFFLLVCRDCGDPERPLPQPFSSQAERGRWAAEHTRATGHDRWIVTEERRA